LIEAQIDIGRGVDPDLLKQQRNLQKQLTSLSQQQLLSDRQSPEQAAAVKGRLAVLAANSPSPVNR
jgi:hypothetical protein